MRQTEKKISMEQSIITAGIVGQKDLREKKKSAKSAPVRNEMHFLCLCLVWHHREFFREMNLEIHKKEIIMHIVRIMRLHGLTGVY